MESSDQTQAVTTHSNFTSNFIVPMMQNFMLKELDRGHNLVFSPLSFQAMLSLIAASTSGNDLQQFLNFLGLENLLDLYSSSMKLAALASPPVSDVASSNDDLSVRPRPTVSFVNSLWLDRRFCLNESFKGVAESIFRVETKDVDFGTQGGRATSEINEWVKQATKGLVKELIPAGKSLDKDTAVVLGNAIYFKGAWDRKFDPSKTMEKDFHLLHGEKVQVPFMTCGKREKHLYFRSRFDNSRILKIPYQGNSDDRHFAMYFFLPGEINGLQNLIQNVLSSDKDFLTQEFEFREEILRDFWIPRFNFSYAIEASELLKNMGLTGLKSGLMEMINCSKSEKSFVSEIFHKAYIEVNEEGTEAAVSTAPRLVKTCAIIPPPAFIADHPFMFMIREDVSKTVFFCGIVLNPLKVV